MNNTENNTNNDADISTPFITSDVAQTIPAEMPAALPVNPIANIATPAQVDMVDPPSPNNSASPMSGNVLECTNLTKLYKGVPALNGVTLSLPRGCITGLLGPNGSGKTTLIKLACGLLAPNGGQILVNGMAPCPETKARVSYLPDRDFLPQWMSVKDALDYYADFFADFDRLRAEDMLNKLGVPTKALIRTLSKGTREKMQLVLAMSRNADLYLLDEPIAGVDPAARDYILQTIISNYRQNASILISTHLIADVEPILDSFLFIDKGQINMVSTVDNIRAERGISVDALFREVYRC